VSAHPLPSVSAPEFSARLTLQDESLRAALAGTADLNVQKQLEVFLGEVHACATKHMAGSVVVDLASLEFINSSCLKAVVGWILSVHGEPPERQYRIVFVANPAAKWQRRSLNALTCMCAELVSVEEA